jgi:KDO2-lipid IV(A) lauroyltransferase
MNTQNHTLLAPAAGAEVVRAGLARRQRTAPPASPPRSAPRASGQLRHRLQYWLRDPIVGALTAALYCFFRLLPVDWSSAIGAGLGRLIGRWFERAATARARRNYLALSRAPVGGAEAEAAMRRMWGHFGRLAGEFPSVDRLWRAGRVEVVGLGHLAAARDAGRPHLMMGLHLGNWEVFGAAMHGLGFPGKFTYLPPPNRFQDRLAVRARRHWGKALPPTFAGTREAWRALVVERAALVIWVDEFVRGRGVMAPLFGRPVRSRSNLLNIVRLALASEAALLPFYVERLAGTRFRLTILPEVQLTHSGDRAADLIENAHRIDDLITPIVTARLDQWLLLPYLRLA